MVPHRGTNWAAPWLTSQIGRDAVFSRSYGRGYHLHFSETYKPFSLDPILRSPPRSELSYSDLSEIKFSMMSEKYFKISGCYIFHLHNTSGRWMNFKEKASGKSIGVGHYVIAIETDAALRSR